MSPQVPTSPVDRAELLRIKLGSSLIIASILAIVVSLAMIIWRIEIKTVTDGVALLGTVTTFLGGVIGVFFGISANSAAHSQSTLAASEASRTAGKAVDAATAAMGSLDTSRTALVQATQTAARAKDAFQDAIGNLRAVAFQAGPLPGQDLAGAVAGEPRQDAAPTMLAGDPADLPGVLALPAGHDMVLDVLSSVVRLDAAQGASAQQIFGSKLIDIAAKEAEDGVSRSTDKARVTEYLKLLGLGFLDANGVPTRYCAAGVTWAACRAYCDANAILYDDVSRLSVLRSVLGDVKRSFKPSASCPDIMSDAQARKNWATADTTPRAGYLVLYNWTGGTQAQHIGIVVDKVGAQLHTIEFNTTVEDANAHQSNGGAVARKVRAMQFVLGYVETY